MQCSARLQGLRVASAGPLQRPARSGLPTRRRLAAPPAAFFNRGGTGSGASADDSASEAPGSSNTLVSDGTIKSLSPEARRIFREAQDNIIELNRSRLRALEELRAARTKIAELEEKLEAAVQEASQATEALQQLGPGGSQQAAAAAASQQVVTYSFDAAQQAALQQQEALQQELARQQQLQQELLWAQQQQQPAEAPPQQPVPMDAGPTITVVYETGWGAAYLHFNADGRGWTVAPGQKMDNGSQQFPDKKVISVPARRLEFVINDGGSDWDKPNPYESKSNYTVTEPGTYRVKNGKVTRLA